MESNVSTKELYDLGDQPPLGEVPSKMHAFMVRQDRLVSRLMHGKVK